MVPVRQTLLHPALVPFTGPVHPRPLLLCAWAANSSGPQYTRTYQWPMNDESLGPPAPKRVVPCLAIQATAPCSPASAHQHPEGSSQFASPFLACQSLFSCHELVLAQSKQPNFTIQQATTTHYPTDWNPSSDLFSMLHNNIIIFNVQCSRFILCSFERYFRFPSNR